MVRSHKIVTVLGARPPFVKAAPYPILFGGDGHAAAGIRPAMVAA